MGEMILMIVITILICGGVPYFAFSYRSRSTKNTSDDKAQANRKVFLLATLILGTFFNCFLFPVYNFTECSAHGWRWYGFFTIAVACFQLGVLSSMAFPYKKGTIIKTIFTLLGVNCIHILAGMGCRYLVEFGEVSNTYNFTLPNMIAHLLVINALCAASWCVAAAEHQKRTKR